MADTLADITLRYSRDESALEAACRARLGDIDERLRQALQAVPAARQALLEYERARGDAAAARDSAVAQADAVWQAAQDQARRKRSDDLLDARQQEVDAGRAADDRKQATIDEAGHAYQSRLVDVDRTVTIDRQAAERQRAFEQYRQALTAADEEWQRSVAAARDQQRADVNASLEQERRDQERADEKRSATVQAADLVKRRLLSAAEEKFGATVASVPEAAQVQADFGQQRAAAQLDCQAREAALFEAFRRDLKNVVST